LTKERIESLIALCSKYMRNEYPDAMKKYIALEVLDTFKSGELHKLLESLEQGK